MSLMAEMNASPIIRFDGVSKSYGKQPVLADLSFDIAPGETVVLMGPSGCGKTTALRCINGLERIQSGEIQVRGVNITQPEKGFNWNRYRAGIGIVFQQYNLFPHLTVLENIVLAPVKVKRIPGAQAREEAMALLEKVGLANQSGRYPSFLSGGEKQRVAIARALAMSSDILLLDEPTSALDPLMTAEVLQTIRNLAHQGITLLIVTHEVQFASQLADRILFMHEGRLTLSGPPATLLEGIHDPVAQRYFERLPH